MFARIVRFTLLAALFIAAPAVAQSVPNQITYQGRLTNSSGQPLPDGAHNVQFAMYTVATGGTAFWWSFAQGVQTIGGVFTAAIGDMTADTLAGKPDVWLEAIVDGQVLAPRMKLTSVPYALISGRALAVADGAVTSAGLAPGAVTTAKVADGAITAAKILNGTILGVNVASNQLVKSINALRDDVTLAAGSNITITPSGNTLTIAATGGGGGIGGGGTDNFIPRWNGVSALEDSAIYQTDDGKVGIGAPAPTHSLTIQSSDENTLRLIGPTGTYKYQGRLNFGDGNNAYLQEDLDDRLTIYSNRTAVMGGYVGIGTTSPSHRLDVNGGLAAHSTTSGEAGVDGQASSAGTMGVRGMANNAAQTINYGVYGEAYGSQGRGVAGVTNGATAIGVYGAALGASGVGVSGDSTTGIGGKFIGGSSGVRGESGTVGIVGIHTGTGNYAELGTQWYGVHAVTWSGNAGYFQATTGAGDGVYAVSDAANKSGVAAFQSNSSGYAVYARNNGSGNMGYIGGSWCGLYAEAGGSSTIAAAFKGNVRLTSKSTGNIVAEIGEGLDYAEGFDVSNSGEIGPGSVLVIDPDNPGKLTVSRQAYDKKVAGIVAGGKGLGSGVRLGAEQFDHDVALAGRVYCNVDATKTAVEPGDLLTTSDRPGYAMKVTNHTRAQGAILGKAMERLEKGRTAQILVLVTLQ
ncbi:MAG: hypothetical protein HYX78_10915 [Armatimonadetes bacterium]|nr:hypothetical protein [Armatimonadota bacterium]